jgi:hypothetical protein
LRGAVHGRNEAVAYAVETDHVPTLANPHALKTRLEIIRGDAEAARRDAEIAIKLSQQNALSRYAAVGAPQSAWANARLHDRETRATDLRRALAALIGQGRFSVPFYQGLLAEIEAQGEAEGALTQIDEALALARETLEHWSDAFLHRCCGEILLKHDPANVADRVAHLQRGQYRTIRSLERRHYRVANRLDHSAFLGCDDFVQQIEMRAHEIVGLEVADAVVQRRRAVNLEISNARSASGRRI